MKNLFSKALCLILAFMVLVGCAGVELKLSDKDKAYNLIVKEAPEYGLSIVTDVYVKEKGVKGIVFLSEPKGGEYCRIKMHYLESNDSITKVLSRGWTSYYVSIYENNLCTTNKEDYISTRYTLIPNFLIRALNQQLSSILLDVSAIRESGKNEISVTEFEFKETGLNGDIEMGLELFDRLSKISYSIDLGYQKGKFVVRSWIGGQKI